MAYRLTTLCGTCMIAGVLATACSSFDKNRRNIVGPTLADLPPVSVDIQKTGLNNEITLDQVENHYQEALKVAKDSGTRRTILIRLADILMLRSEENMLEAERPGRFFDEVIQRYRELIALQKQTIAEGGDVDRHSQELDKMLYQLSKAYALDGRIESSDEKLKTLTVDYADSAYSPEAKFRRAEQAFSNEDYEVSEKLYNEVINEGTFTPYYQNAIYMHGWSQFKNVEYEGAIDAFIKVLDHLYGTSAPINTIPKSQQGLVDDTLRVISLSFSYLDGPKTLSRFFAGKSGRPYSPKLYRALGQLYFSKKRYRDSAEAYRQYVLDNPFSDGAPLFSAYVIDVYEQGNFPSLLIPAKEEYVNNYGIDSQYWQSKSDPVRAALSKNLLVYLEELAKYEHANGQAYLNKDRNTSSRKQSGLSASGDPKLAFLKAANWYDQFVRTFPNHSKTSGMYFLMAEALSEAGEWQRAFDTYRWLAYDYKLPDTKKTQGAEAGYSAILMAQKLLKKATTPVEKQQWQNHVIDQSIAFADKYTRDQRSPNVLNAAAEMLLQIDRQAEAIIAAKRVAEWQPQAEAALRRSAFLVVGQSEFDLGNYQGSDQAYAYALKLTAKNSPAYQSTVDRQAASIYKYAEGLLADKQTQAAVTQFLRVQDVAPDSDIAITAQYDAGNQLLELKRWQQAEAIFLNFRRRYPKHSLIKTLYAKMVVIYQETQRWELAGNELTAMSAVSDDPVLRRRSLLLGAELYEKSDQTTRAINNYQQYIKRYPQPLDDRLEAINKLANLQKSKKNIARYEYWLKQLITINSQAGTKQTDRSRYLAAMAQNYQAAKDYQRFAKIRLTLPLKASLARKKSALSKTVASYQKVIDYGVADYVTEANYYLGEIYVRLSKDLMQSQRPKGLNALALDQYELLLEEQIYPFEEKAIELHQSNVSRVQKNLYDDWVKRSYQSLAVLSPGRYKKPEQQGVIHGLY